MTDLRKTSGDPGGFVSNSKDHRDLNLGGAGVDAVRALSLVGWYEEHHYGCEQQASSSFVESFLRWREVRWGMEKKWQVGFPRLHIGHPQINRIMILLTSTLVDALSTF